MPKLKRSLQENILTMLCFSTTNARTVRNLVDASKFDGIYRTIASHAIDYLDAYQTPAGSHLPDLLEDELAEGAPQADLFRETLTHMLHTHTQVNETFVLTKLSTFLTIQSMREGIVSAAQLLQDESDQSVESAEQVLSQLRKTQISLFDPGIYFGTPEALNFVTTPPEAFATGIPQLDRRHLGPARKELHLLMGLLGRGKTWWLIHLGKHALRQRLRICHITLEVSAQIVLQRYYQSVFAITKRRDQESMVTTWETDSLGRIHTLGSRAYVPSLTFDQPDIQKQLAAKHQQWGKRLQNLIVKEFPTGSISTRQLASYLDTLYDTAQFTPDLLLLDYADLMKINPDQQRLETSQIYKDLRGMAGERNMAVVTVSQSNREGVKRRHLTEANLGEDFSKGQTADVFLAYNQTQQEAKRGLARLQILKARTEEGFFNILISQNYAAGQFCIQSHELSEKKYWEEVDKDEEAS